MGTTGTTLAFTRTTVGFLGLRTLCLLRSEAFSIRIWNDPPVNWPRGLQAGTSLRNRRRRGRFFRRDPRLGCVGRLVGLKSGLEQSVSTGAPPRHRFGFPARVLERSSDQVLLVP
ncbi:hypothetical protein BO71DRAFT_152473 [Aspergillus ellipticus CBS 707.79]|uniref:Uncharacterized protein n=1 Tax=Aspergillus ellipticus CBS 707.79 TaxID=1448320 RepID=A0A319CRR6_9EURO|nr:hypothetical protein BO71DRAFT_152473 [Aspergillus ellipticus CBS 707.79]